MPDSPDVHSTSQAVMADLNKSQEKKDKTKEDLTPPSEIVRRMDKLRALAKPFEIIKARCNVPTEQREQLHNQTREFMTEFQAMQAAVEITETNMEEIVRMVGNMQRFVGREFP